MFLRAPSSPPDLAPSFVFAIAASRSSANALTVGWRSPGCRARPFMTAASSSGENLRSLASEIEQLHAPRARVVHDVLGFQVAMNDTGRVRGRERVGQLAHQRDGVRRSERTLAV